MANETKGEKKKKRSIGRWFKETFSELKKVSWPTFPQVVKQTGVVLLVTLCFLIVLMAMDILLGYLFDLLKSGMNVSAVTISALSGQFAPVTLMGVPLL